MKFEPGNVAMPYWMDVYDAIIRPYFPEMPSHVTELTLKIGVNEIPQMVVTFIPTLLDVDCCGEPETVTKKFAITPIEDEPSQ